MISFIPRQSIIQISIGFVLIPALFLKNSNVFVLFVSWKPFRGSQRGRGGAMRTHVGRNCVQTGMDVDRVTRSTRPDAKILPASQKHIKRVTHNQPHQLSSEEKMERRGNRSRTPCSSCCPAVAPFVSKKEAAPPSDVPKVHLALKD